MSDIEEKFIQERLAHEKSESKLFEQLQQLKAENEELKLLNLNIPNFIEYGEEKGWREIVDSKIFENAELSGKLQQAEQKLEKIKEICNEIETDKVVEYILEIIEGKEDES